MALLAYDSARPKLIPKDPAAVLPYADGHFNWQHTEFPHALYRYITVLGDPNADIADYEPGCIYDPDTLRLWAERRMRLGHHDLTVYCDRGNVSTVERAMIGLDWHLFLTTLDGTRPTEYDGIKLRAVQFTDRSNEFDVSVIYDTDWLNKP